MRFLQSLAIAVTSLVVWAPFASPVSGQDLEQRLRPLLEAHRGQVSLAVRHLETGESFYYEADRPMPTASLIKVAVMTEVYRQIDLGSLSPDQTVRLERDDRVPGSGILTGHFSDGLQLPLRDAVRLMIAWSDNTATNLLLDEVSLEAVNATMTELGLEHTRIHAMVFRRDTSIDPEASRQFGLGRTTAREMMGLFTRLQRGELVSEEASRGMIEHLRECRDRNKLARHLPDDVVFAHKSGSVTRARCDAGLLETPRGPVVVCVLTRENADRSWNSDNEAEALCAAIGREIWRHFTPPTSSPQAGETPAELREGSSGPLVGALQRTLNARLEPSSELSIDGEFGPQTRAAVERFQVENDLEATAVVDSATWSALGPLLTEDAPVPPPDVVNGEELEREPPDPESGPPFVTARAWAVADAATGTVLAEHAADVPRPMASTTKIMTAVLVLEAAEADPSVLDQTVTFSQRADDTGGSTTRIRAGESLAVRELLYGLLLPSGNDAAVALAEHFGAEFTPEGESESESDPLETFVARMNRRAEELGLSQTGFRNPHGMTAGEHQASAADLIRLTRYARELPHFATITGTRQRGCTVTGPGGYTRHVRWKNTNRLLGIQGYVGTKTGTTSAAGACLVAECRRGERALLLVILGSSSSDARYADARNLFQWGWQQYERSDLAP